MALNQVVGYVKVMIHKTDVLGTFPFSSCCCCWTKKDGYKNETDTRLIYVRRLLPVCLNRDGPRFGRVGSCVPKDIYVSVVATERLTKSGAACLHTATVKST